MLSNLKKYYIPKTIPEALALLEKNSGSILVVAGGSKLVQTDNRIVQELVDITHLELDYLKESPGEIRIGATTPLQSLIDSRLVKHSPFKIIAQATQLSYSSKMIRNVATLGGELISSDSLSVLYCALLVLQAQIRIVGGNEFALAINIFLAKKGLGGGLLIETIIPKPQTKFYTGLAPIFYQNKKVIICACAYVVIHEGKCRNVRIAITGTEKVPQRLPEAESYLEGKKLNNETIDNAAQTAYKSYQPITDSLASKNFRKEVCRAVLKNALTQCLQEFEDQFDA